jgi:hypothetical protein
MGGGMGAMPAGHPSMDDMLAAQAATQPGAKGSLSIAVIPGSAGGANPANNPVTVELFHRGSPLKKFDLKLDGQAKLVIPELPLTPPVQALISIKHSGLLQQAIAPELSVENPNPAIQLKVYEPTEEKPAWTVAMQHVIVQWAEDGSGARVVEMISANTPGDRAWLGDKVAATTAGGADSRITMTIPLPPQIDQLELGGSFDEDASKLVDGKLITAGPLFPGRSEYRLTYTVPAKDGALELPIAPPTGAQSVGNLIVFLPADGTDVKATGISGGEAVDMGEGKVRMYRAQDLAPNFKVNLSIRGIKPTPAAAAADSSDDVPLAAAPSRFSARNLAMGGAFLMVLIGAGLMLMKKPQPKKA